MLKKINWNIIIELIWSSMIIVITIINIALNLGIINYIYIIALTSILIYYFLLPELFTIFDICNYKRYKYYEEIDNTVVPRKNMKKNIIILIIFTIVYLIIVGITYPVCNYIGLDYASILLIILSLMLIFNSLFIFTKYCLVRIIIFRKEVNCCNDCYIMGTGSMLLSLALIHSYYIPEIHIMPKVLTTIILIYSVFNTIRWFRYLYIYPKRFFPETNGKLKCNNCRKKKNCTGAIRHKFSE